MAQPANSVFQLSKKSIPQLFSSVPPKEKKMCQCPICDLSLPLADINKHLDNECKGEAAGHASPCTTMANKLSTSKTKKRRRKEKTSTPCSSAPAASLTVDTISGNERVAVTGHENLLKWRMMLNPFKSTKCTPCGTVIDLTNDDRECRKTAVTPDQSTKPSGHAEYNVAKSNNLQELKGCNTPENIIDGTLPETETNTFLKTQSNPENPLNMDDRYISRAEDSATKGNNLQELEECRTLTNQTYTTSPKVEIDTDLKTLSNGENSQNINDTLKMSSSDTIEDMDANKTIYPPYYIANFKYIVESVLSDEYNTILFNDRDRELAALFHELDESSQKLYVRLYLRKYGWFRCSKINYPRIMENLTPLFHNLVEKGFLDNEYKLEDIETALSILSAAETKSIAGSFHVEKSSSGEPLRTKPDFIKAIIHFSKRQQSILSFAKGGGSKTLRAKIFSSIKSMLGKCVQLSDEPRNLFLRIFAMFSVAQYNADEDEGRQDQSHIFRLLQFNRGQISYPDFVIDRTIPIFQTRQELTDYTEGMQLEDKLDASAELKNFEDAYATYLIAKQQFDAVLKMLQSGPGKDSCWSVSLPLQLRRFSAEWVYCRICGKSVEVLEKLGRYDKAVALLKELLSQKVYSISSRGRYWERLALDTEKYLKNPDQALDIIKDALEDSYVRTGRRLALINRASRICKSQKNKNLKHKLSEMTVETVGDPIEVTISGPMFLDTSSSSRTIFISGTSDDQSGQSYSAVEEYTINYYKEHGYSEGIHGEGATFTFLFALMMWEVIFLSRPNVFVTVFQAGPLDLPTDLFYESRKEEIDFALHVISQASDSDIRNKIEESWNAHYGTFCNGLNWERFESVGQVQDLAVCLGPVVLAGVFELFCKDYINRSSGIPDLVVWDPNRKKSKIVEVKGPGDRLSLKQIIWLDVFTTLGADAEVCYVRAIGGKRKRLSNME